MLPKNSPLPPPPMALRWTALVVISLAMFGSSYIYDSIGPLAKVLSDQLRFSDSQIGLLQAICSLPSIFMALLGGIIIDRIGVKKAGMIFALICLAGSVITTLSPLFPVLLAGRLVFGLGIGSLAVVGSTGIAQWFRGDKLSFAFGLNLTINRLGSLAAQISPTWAKAAYASWRSPLLIAVIFGLLSVAAAALYWIIENHSTQHYQILGERDTSRPIIEGRLGFGRSYWLSVGLCVTFYSGIFPFQTFAQKFLVEARGTAPEQASILVGVITVTAMIMTPLFGLLVDRAGRRAVFLVIGCALLVPVYLLLGYTVVTPFLPVSLMGLAFSLVPAVLWPSIMLLVPHQNLGKAFGLMSMVQSVGLTGFNFVIGRANDLYGAGPAHPDGYLPGMWLFTLASLAALGFAVLLLGHERGPRSHGLNSPCGRNPVHP